MLTEDVEMLMGHCRCSPSANGELLGAMTRIKKALEESCQLPTTKVKSSADATAEQICHCREGAAWASHLVNHEKLHWTYCPNCGKLLLT